MKRWDFFCKIVDNFGDIGICWRLARQLQTQHGLQVKLWVDDLASAQKIIPSLNVHLNQQLIDDIAIYHWTEDADFSQAADVVIEAFACDLPLGYLASMAQQKSPTFKTKWINLEYLSAELWVDDFHGKPSPKPELKLTRHFYFPGFTEKTGGLIRDIAMPPLYAKSVKAEALKVSLFCYPFAPIGDLLDALQASKHAVHVTVPQSSILLNIASFFGKKNVEVGNKLVKNNLTVEILPFLSQADYDALLRDCDVNFVRGEDSWIRAIWAGKPFIWQPYKQDENAHMKKLNAFLNVFYDKTESACEAHRYWSAGQLPEHVWNTYLADLINIQSHTHKQAKTLAKQQDLATKLVAFCNKL